MSNGDNLRNAKDAKQDEFYTQLSDIENELRHYRKHFKGKTVFCNCDDPYESNFFKYFAMNFNYLGLKKLITTCYVSSPIVYTQLSLFPEMEFSFNSNSGNEKGKKPYKVEITEVSDENGDGAFDLDDIKHLLKSKKNACTVLKGDGDFRSDECVELLKQADIVVTNPPFSLFREYMAQLIAYEKKFIIIGNQNAVSYKEVFPLLKNNQIWLGYHSGHTLFAVPDTYSIPDFYDLSDKSRLRSNGYIIDKDGKLWRNLGNICWFTNCDIEKRHEDLIVYKHYSPENYLRYDNFDAIEVSKVVDIPCDYTGVMGVPISFLDKYNPQQFEIIGLGTGDTAKKIGITKNYRGRTDLALTLPNGKHTCPYNRILIRKKEQQHEN